MILNDKISKDGFSLVEALLALAFFSLVITSIIGSITYGQESSVQAGSLARASYLASEGVEALRNLKDESFSNLSDSTYGLAVSGGQWVLSGQSDTIDIFTRQVAISTVNENTKQAVVTVTWPQNLQRNGSVSLVTQLTNWRAPILKGGMLVYGNGGTSSDEIKFQVMNPTTGNWSDPASADDVDPGSTNKYLRAVKIYSSADREEKVMISRHYNGTTQYIYAQVYDGQSWGDVTELSSWNSTAFLEVQNFSGTYLADGRFLAVYSDNTSTPRMKIWNGSSWSSSSALTNLGSGQIPAYITATQRPGTNEVMAAFFTQASATSTQYYNGTSWSSATTHATAAPANNKRLIDFEWSLNAPAAGVLVYASNNKAKSISAKVWTANGAGSGSWGAASASSNQSGYIGPLAVFGRLGANEFQVCNKESASRPDIRCYKIAFNGGSAVFSNPNNQTIASNVDSGNQRSFDVDYESEGGSAVAVFSDNTTTPKLKTYNPSTGVWSANATKVKPAVLFSRVAIISPMLIKIYTTLKFPKFSSGKAHALSKFIPAKIIPEISPIRS